jgi:hypothetical protein
LAQRGPLPHPGLGETVCFPVGAAVQLQEEQFQGVLRGRDVADGPQWLSLSMDGSAPLGPGPREPRPVHRQRLELLGDGGNASAQILLS